MIMLSMVDNSFHMAKSLTEVIEEIKGKGGSDYVYKATTTKPEGSYTHSTFVKDGMVTDYYLDLDVAEPIKRPTVR